jgi:hypothetical protein
MFSSNMLSENSAEKEVTSLLPTNIFFYILIQRVFELQFLGDTSLFSTPEKYHTENYCC